MSDKIKEILGYCYSDSDIKHYLGKDAKVMKYAELNDYTSLSQLLPNPTDFAVILIETKRNNGHFCVLLRYNNIFEWFDPYGLKPDQELGFVSNIMRRILHEEDCPLTRLINDTEFPVIYNDKALQSKKPFVSTCGRWACLRVLKLIRDGYDLKTFIAYLKEFKRQHNLQGVLAYDMLVSTEINYNGQG